MFACSSAKAWQSCFNKSLDPGVWDNMRADISRFVELILSRWEEFAKNQQKSARRRYLNGTFVFCSSRRTGGLLQLISGFVRWSSLSVSLKPPFTCLITKFIPIASAERDADRAGDSSSIFICDPAMSIFPKFARWLKVNAMIVRSGASNWSCAFTI